MTEADEILTRCTAREDQIEMRLREQREILTAVGVSPWRLIRNWRLLRECRQLSAVNWRDLHLNEQELGKLT